jgi:hypothetical protein
MKQRSPTLEGFRAVFRQPAIPLAEIAWRWSFGVAAIFLLGASLLEYFDTLPVSVRDMLLLRSRQPILIARAISHIFHDSAFRFAFASVILMAALTIGWSIIAAIGRAATVKALLDYFSIRNQAAPSSDRSHGLERKQSKPRSLLGLNLLRVVLTLATAIACVGAAILAGFASSSTDPQPGLVFLLFMPLILLVWLLWSVLNWFLSVASLFLIDQNNDTLGAISAAVDLCRARLGPILSVGFWFLSAHVFALVVATTIAAFPLAFARVLPGGVVLGGMLLVMLLYFAVADFLYVGRLAAYACIIEQPDSPPQPAILQPIAPLGVATHLPPPVPASEDDILSDIPLRGPTPQPS